MLHDGIRVQVETDSLVPDDVLIIEEGDRICADARLLDGGVEVGMSMLTGWNWLAIALTTVEVTLTVFGSVRRLAAAQQRLSRPYQWMGPAVSRSAYGAFILQTPVLIGLAVALLPVPLTAEAKAVIVAAAGVAVCFGLAHVLIRHVRAVARIL